MVIKYKIRKDGKLVKYTKGNLIHVDEYNKVLNENQLLKDKFSVKNFNLKLITLIEELNLDINKKFLAQSSLATFIFVLESLEKENKK